MRIFHIATATDWATAQASGSYTTSTIGRTLAQEGFLHASRGDQWQGVHARYYSEVTEPLVLLVINTDRLDVPVVEEEVPGGETFPHIYGALRPDAVVQVLPLDRGGATSTSPSPGVGGMDPATATDSGTASPAASVASTPAAPQQSFTSLFIREMAFRAGLGLAVLVVAMLIGQLARSAWGDTPALILAILTVVVGIGVGWVLSRRRDAKYAAAHPR